MLVSIGPCKIEEYQPSCHEPKCHSNRFTERKLASFGGTDKVGYFIAYGGFDKFVLFCVGSIYIL